MNMIGVIEGFFGPQWPMEDRLSYAEFLAEYGGDFFIYAPKQDPYLRKKWRDNWSVEYMNHLGSLRETFQKNKIKFGVGFSPFGLGTDLSNEDKKHIETKMELLQKLNIDILGLFFDDMPITPNLAETQIECLNLVKSHFKGKIVFCPSFYTPDPLLDRVFGQRPQNYLNDIASGVDKNVSIAWTGPKVISPEIPVDHLKETVELLKRKPFIWENLFANDGPKNCKFIKLKPFAGRSNESTNYTEAFGFNMMNQPSLSKISYLSSLLVLRNGLHPETALDSAFSELCTPEFAQFLREHNEALLTVGLDNIPADDKKSFVEELKSFPDAAAKELIDWLCGNYNVGTECLTD